MRTANQTLNVSANRRKGLRGLLPGNNQTVRFTHNVAVGPPIILTEHSRLTDGVFKTDQPGLIIEKHLKGEE